MVQAAGFLGSFISGVVFSWSVYMLLPLGVVRLFFSLFYTFVLSLFLFSFSFVVGVYFFARNTKTKQKEKKQN